MSVATVTSVRCRIMRGFVKEVEEEINKFLSSHTVCVVHMAQSESIDHVSVTLLYTDAAVEPLGRLDPADR